MSRKIYLFNPENDLALANGNENFEAPLSARKLAFDLALLPLWYADKDSLILTSQETPEEWKSKERQILGINSSWCTSENLKKNLKSDDVFVPWGWSPVILKKWQKINGEKAPEQKKINIIKYRELSHRAFTLKILSYLRDEFLLKKNFEMPERLFSISEVKNYITRKSSVILKAPWSGSGRGLFRNNGNWDYNTEHWAQHILEKQKSILGESFLQKKEDFAMEFYSNGIQSNFVGYSSFFTDKYGIYRGNSLNRDIDIENSLSKYISQDLLHEIQKKLAFFFSKEISPFYEGYFGVDMMIYSSETIPSTYLLHPCVELNLRMNMGVVSYLFYDQYVSENSYGNFYIEHSSEPYFLQKKDIERSHNNPVKLMNGKIQSGYFSLTPVTQNTYYQVWVELMKK